MALATKTTRGGQRNGRAMGEWEDSFRRDKTLKTRESKDLKFTFLGKGWEVIYGKGAISTVRGRNNVAGQWNM